MDPRARQERAGAQQTARARQVPANPSRTRQAEPQSGSSLRWPRARGLDVQAAHGEIDLEDFRTPGYSAGIRCFHAEALHSQHRIPSVDGAQYGDQAAHIRLERCMEPHASQPACHDAVRQLIEPIDFCWCARGGEIDAARQIRSCFGRTGAGENLRRQPKQRLREHVRRISKIRKGRELPPGAGEQRGALVERRVCLSRTPQGPGNDAQSRHRTRDDQPAEHERSLITRSHGVDPPKTIVNRSHSWPATVSWTTAPSSRGLESTCVRSSAASTFAAGRAVPETTPEPSACHEYEVKTAESGKDALTRARATSASPWVRRASARL